MNPLEHKLKFVQRKSTALKLANMLGNTLGSFLDGFGVDPQERKKCDQYTTKSLKKCDKINGGKFSFHTIQFYARPIQEVGVHNTVTDAKTSEEEHKNNALNASNGYHHGLLILSYNKPEPTQYLLDRVEGVRFVKIDTVEEEELTSGHLVLVKEYKTHLIKYKHIKQFIQKESKLPYNGAKNNCLHFVYNFIDVVLKKNQWDKDFNKFWSYIMKHFDVDSIESGEYNTQRNYLLNQKLQLEKQIRKKNDRELRLKWVKGSKIWIKSKNAQATESWYSGKITQIRKQIRFVEGRSYGNINEVKEIKVYVEYTKMGKTCTAGPIDIYSTSKEKVKPYVEIPAAYLDPITNKIMEHPVQILRSGIIYDAVTVKYMQKRQILLDPMTGVLISQNPVVESQRALRKAIHTFIKEYDILKTIINDYQSVNDDKLWEDVFDKLHEKYDIKQQQQKIYKKCAVMFYPAKAQTNIQKQMYWYNNIRFYPKKKANDDDEKTIDMDMDTLQWNSDHMFINHKSIPIITCFGPSRIGKSFLLNEILRNQPKWKNDDVLNKTDVFKTSRSADDTVTKGAWISLYGEIEEEDEKTENDIVLIDQWPEDDISVWSTNDIICWFTSLNPKFEQKFRKLIQLVKFKCLDGRVMSKYTLQDIRNLIKGCDMSKKDEMALVDILDKRVRNVMDQIDSDKITQMYLVDTEGLSHDVTEFTHKIFHGSYAISNVLIWLDSEVNSGRFKKLMKELEESMEIVANSTRKPAFIYIYRNANCGNFSFPVPNGVKDDKFNYYINNSKTFKDFRKMNIFSSIHGYRLRAPENYFRIEESSDSDESDVDQEYYYKRKTLNKLIGKIQQIANKTKRFANNAYILNDQINNINKCSSLSPEKRIALCNQKLKWFVLIDKSNNEQKMKQRELQIKNAIVKFREDVSSVEQDFQRGYESLQTTLRKRSWTISTQFNAQLMKNKTEIILTIKKRLENNKKANKFQAASAFVGIGGGLGVVGLGVATVLSGGAVLLVGAGVGIVSGGFYMAGKKYRPEKLDDIQEEGLEELNMFE
eukprot:234471_1